jgi:ABC-type amino acid transport substrate-binding protein
MQKIAAIRSMVFISWCLALPVQASVPQPANHLPPPAEPPQLIWCLDHFPHFHEYDQTDTPSGPSVDIMQELARRAGFTLHVTPRTSLARCLRLMQQGKADLMSNLRYSEERSTFMTLLPYFNNVAESLFIRITDKRLIDSKVQLSSLTLATLRHFLYNPATMALIEEQSRHITQVDSIELALEMLLRQRIDGLVAPTISTTEAINTTSSYQQRFKIAPLDFSAKAPNNLHIAIAKNSKHAALEPLLRQHLQAMLADGSVQRFMLTPEQYQPLNPPKQL